MSNLTLEQFSKLTLEDVQIIMRHAERLYVERDALKMTIVEMEKRYRSVIEVLAVLARRAGDEIIINKEELVMLNPQDELEFVNDGAEDVYAIRLHRHESESTGRPSK